MKHILAGIITVLFSSANISAQTTDTQYNLLAEQFLAELTAQLKDADSAKFRSVFVVKPNNGTAVRVCTEVNAKNSYGAYAGFKLYTGTPDRIIHSGTFNGRSADVLWSAFSEGCSNGPVVYRHPVGELTGSSLPNPNIALSADLTEKLHAYATLYNFESDSAAAEYLLNSFLNPSSEQ